MAAAISITYIFFFIFYYQIINILKVTKRRASSFEGYD